MIAPLVCENNILEYIPQRPPIVMVSEILTCNEEGISTSFYINKNNIFVAENYLQEAGVIENIAQTAAAMTGYHAKTNNKEVKRGFIGSVKKLTIEKLPIAEVVIRTEVKIVTEVMNATVIEGVVFQNNKRVANCEMNIFLEE